MHLRVLVMRYHPGSLSILERIKADVSLGHHFLHALFAPALCYLTPKLER